MCLATSTRKPIDRDVTKLGIIDLTQKETWAQSTSFASSFNSVVDNRSAVCLAFPYPGHHFQSFRHAVCVWGRSKKGEMSSLAVSFHTQCKGFASSKSSPPWTLLLCHSVNCYLATSSSQGL